MSKKESDVVLNFKMNGEINYSRTIKDINKEMNLAATEYKNQVSAMDKNATQTEKLTATKKKLEKQLSLAEQRTKLLREEYEKSVKETGEYSEQSQKLYKRLLESETGENKLRSALESTNEALKEQGNLSVKTAEKLAKIEKTGDKMKSVGKKMSIGLTAPIVGIGTASIKAFSEVDEGMDTVTAKTGATGKELEKLQESFKNVAANAPDSFEDVGIAVGEVNTRLGFTGEKLEKASDDFLKFATVNKTDVEGAIQLVTRAMGDAGIEADKYNQVLDYLTVAGQKSGISVDKLAENLAKYGAPMRALGIDTKNAIALFAGWEKAGVNTEIAFSGMKKAISNWGKEGKNSGEEFKKVMQQIKDAPDIASATTLAIEAFGSKAGPDLADAIKGGRFEVDEYVKALEEAGGALDQTFDDMQDPPDQAKVAMNNIKLILNDLGQTILGVLAPSLQNLTEWLKNLQQWFTNLSPNAKQLIVVIGGIAAAIGPVLVVLGTLASSISSLIPVIAFIASPIGLVIAAVAAWVAAIVVAYNKIGWFRDFINTSFKVIKDIVVGVFNVLKDTTKSTFDFITGFIGGAMDGAAKIIGDYVNAIKRIFGGIVDFVTGVFTGDWSRAWQGVVDIFGGIFEGIAAVAKAPINAMITLINGFIGGLNNIKIPKWVPGIGGKGFHIGKIPYLAEGGTILNGQAIVGEAGPELLTAKNGKTTVTPLSPEEKARGIGGALKGGNTIEQHVHIGQVDANNPSELDRMNRKLYKASAQAFYDLGGVPT
ncbi:phage tail tape measure protein [Enterococcus faecalis]|uniref:Phage tail tape measure protein n=1 Tax=Enterococcus faecalis TaxID=1351 RepID=A0ABD7J077_ENTFL|nr:phage tail tape measure protein [Enterococcus faecalis]HCQ2036541.1 phage tail tape measure protein [Staphylococcus aureus]AUC59087.1 phage tail tape measure protein [Enterococcus faecalis ARO1/DG]EEU88769.1 tail tape measure protein [Enterococcus faecalis ARO1/DG]EGO5023898.1 phage tail tape measure protein [Enterococcus faecalis]EGO5041065.1 phage tail tape measure protein [Enterococcus faecalis]